ncbi:uncharacterized protein LOC124935016 [Impatiens glandulifera]|uniref:uncharacterized protein LOC124935016 n=1 Tax=Impatiens glandulifera TaxID=253017 RepID=UPI001FB14A6C|nr:uncharacterized protein LOC124935016 [Impatiens glandulifera]
MSTEVESVNNETELGRRRRRRRQPALEGGDITVLGDSLDECRFPEIERNIMKIHMNRVTDCLSEDDDDDYVDLENGELEPKVDPPGKEESNCRICHLNSTEDEEFEAVIELGCSCKGKLGTAHKHCAETWFKIRGNSKCEICGSEAVNITIVVQNEAVGGGGGGAVVVPVTAMVPPVAVVGPVIIGENGSSWNGQRVMNILLACVIILFVISWFFHLRMLSS